MDMINRTITTPRATLPMFLNISTRLTCIARPPGLVSFLSFPSSACVSRQPEVHGHGHDDRHGHAVEQGGRVDPLLDGLDGGGVEEGDAAEDRHVGDLALGAD